MVRITMTLTEIPWPAVSLIIVQSILLMLFSLFAFFNYIYGICALRTPRIKRVVPSGERVAVVIVAFNEKHVLENTVTACEKMTYENKFIVLADDSTDPEIVANLRELAVQRGCKKLLHHNLFQEYYNEKGVKLREPIEIWESPDFVLFHRPSNIGFKGGSLRKIHEYLSSRGVDLMYLLDADWRPQKDVIEKSLAVLEANETTAFVQTKRLSYPVGMNLFQKYVTIVEEGCYHVDFQGRQVLGHPTLFSGCCTMFRLRLVAEVGGFTSGHLTEDLDLTNRLWLAGWQGVYDGEIVNYGEVPFTYDHFRRQQERWAAGSSRALREYFRPIVTTKHLGWFAKLSALRQNAYFTTTLLTTIAIIVGMFTVLWLSLAWNSYAVEYYLYVLGIIKIPFVSLLYFCILSNLVEPLVMILVKKRSYRDLVHLPMTIWYAWSVIYTYTVGNLKGLMGVKLDWFRTPKYIRKCFVFSEQSTPISIRAINLFVCILVSSIYFAEGWMFGWFDEFAMLLVPAFILGAIK
jgi:cellulose synthase/poly-beta-1,6-N-acetylglucosamine synthase-like glycosyltransferase